MALNGRYRINQGKIRQVGVKRDLYDWWKGKIIESTTYGHPDISV